jgi:hypothetical protein
MSAAGLLRSQLGRTHRRATTPSSQPSASGSLLHDVFWRTQGKVPSPWMGEGQACPELAEGMGGDSPSPQSSPTRGEEVSHQKCRVLSPLGQGALAPL